ncbi:Hypothetical protein NTJ_02030 [Nesidiocoris tenuis]|uniref:Uncharacterized protein n=1 Tax=Nesidiocoris tenuis TaxID=355587 RepID=A0ABN7AB21_9HEMI|nr:Hypothetical protein NTJ_02030 [Nesidiocoris tenuis]
MSFFHLCFLYGHEDKRSQAVRGVRMPVVVLMPASRVAVPDAEYLEPLASRSGEWIVLPPPWLPFRPTKMSNKRDELGAVQHCYSSLPIVHCPASVCLALSFYSASLLCALCESRSSLSFSQRRRRGTQMW